MTIQTLDNRLNFQLDYAYMSMQERGSNVSRRKFFKIAGGLALIAAGAVPLTSGVKEMFSADLKAPANQDARKFFLQETVGNPRYRTSMFMVAAGMFVTLLGITLAIDDFMQSKFGRRGRPPTPPGT